MRRGLLAALLAVGLGAGARAEAPRSVVSLNLCADQLLLALGEPGRISGISPYARDAARGGAAAAAAKIPLLSGTAEEVLMIAPDLVVAGRYDRRATQEMISRRGIRLETFDIPRSLADARSQIGRMGGLLGAEDKADRLIGEIDAALARLRHAAAGGLRVLPYARRGWVEGGGTLLGDLLRAGGLANAGDAAGLAGGGFIGLEDVIRLKPDALIVASSGGGAEDQGSALLLHPAIQALFPRRRLVLLPEALTICGGPALIAAMDGLAAQLSDMKSLPPRD